MAFILTPGSASILGEYVPLYRIRNKGFCGELNADSGPTVRYQDDSLWNVSDEGDLRMTIDRFRGILPNASQFGYSLLSHGGSSHYRS